MNRPQIGFIGLGSQGAPMAERIVGVGFPLTVWARRPEVTEPFREQGAKVAADLSSLGETCEIVGICVRDDDGLKEVCKTLLPAMRSGSLIVVHSTVLPQTCIELAREGAPRGIDVLDAPVSGGQPAASAGVLTVMCGGSSEAFERARPVLETFGKVIRHVGELGSGQLTKIVNNAMLSATMGIARSGLMAASALGIRRDDLVEVVKASSGRSFGFEIYARIADQPSVFAEGASLQLKDIRLLKSLLADDPSADALAAATPFFDAVLKS